MDRSNPLRRVVARVLGRDRLESAEQAARQAASLSRVQSERIEALERRVAQSQAEAEALRSRVDAFERADPQLTREVVSSVRADVQRLVADVNRLLDGAQG